MADLSRHNAEILLVIEELVMQMVVMLGYFLLRLRNRPQQRRTNNDLRVRYRMASRLPKQVIHLKDLVGGNDTDCMDNLRMDRATFSRLCHLLRHRAGLNDSRYVSLSEKVAFFLTVLGHHTKNRIVRFDFTRSGQTFSKHFHSVLNSVLTLHDILLFKPDPVEDDCTIARWKWFKGCIGALDGTYIGVCVSETDKARYRTRKGTIAVNVLAACDRDMTINYMLTGWEGSAADCRVLRDAVNRPHGLKIPQGYYYLCDNGYMNGEGFLTPFKSVRYHLDEWGNGAAAPQNYNEFFNMNHSKARNVIERTFGLLKKCWAILRSPTFYPIAIQNRMIMACALLHNFIRREMPTDPLNTNLEEVDLEQDEGDATEYINSVQSSQGWFGWRENLARSMWDEWKGIA